MGRRGGNLDACYDDLNLVELEAERNRLVWRHSDRSRRCIGPPDLIVGLIRDEPEVELVPD